MKRIIITGGTGGLGGAVASVFRENGWETIQLGRRDLDLSDETAVKEFFRREACDVLVCAAGMVNDIPLARMPESAWDDVFGLNYTAGERCARAALPGMAERGCGHVVFISSHAAIDPTIGQVAYGAAKAALLGLTSSLAEAWGRKGIRINAVLPGFLETAMTAGVSAKRREAVMKDHRLGQLNTKEAAADFIFFLEGRMPHTSGQVFQLDSRRGFF
ncbi:SDR family oxidoreductase [Akkermansiaceae bacterium]|nr:SDR family oxidoreductase [Akkermansiaceae bacterium]